jgi:hypothetical protein
VAGTNLTEGSAMSVDDRTRDLAPVDEEDVDTDYLNRANETRTR